MVKEISNLAIGTHGCNICGLDGIHLFFMMAKQEYKVGIGIWKTIKNVVIVWGIPAVLLLADNYTEWIPNEYEVAAAPIIGAIAYFIKNYIQNRK